MEILTFLPDTGEEVMLSDGRVVILSPYHPSGSRFIFENELEVGVIQYLYTDPYGLKVFLVSISGRDGTEKRYLEYLVVNTTLLDKQRQFDAIASRNNWIFEFEKAYETFEKLYCHSSSPEVMSELLNVAGSKNTQEKIAFVKLAQKALLLLETPQLRGEQEFVDFWLSKALPLFRLLEITIS